MLDIKFIRENADLVKRNVKNRRIDVDIDVLLQADAERLSALKPLEDTRKRRNEVAEQMKSAASQERPALIEEGKRLKEEATSLEHRLETAEAKLKELLLMVPNMTHPESPLGASDADNLELKVVGEVKQLSFPPKDHVTLGKDLNIIDFERGAKVSGAKFYFLKGKLAMLEQALITWTMQELVAEGYLPMSTPDLAKDDVLLGAGFQPRGAETQIYSIENSDLSLIGTSEITLGGYHMDEVIDEDQLPLKYMGLSHCYRTEAGTYGRESYGLYRVHQFSKVEMYIFAAPWQSEALHEELRRLEENIFTKLGIPFRVVDICTGDLGGPAYRKYDLEAWMWGRNSAASPPAGGGVRGGGWGEVTSASNCTDYQARRLNIKVRKKDGSLEYVHTLNGTAISLARALLTIIENYQQADGSILIPEVLVPLTGFDRIS